MSIPLTGTGGLFTRWAKIGRTLRNLNLYRGTGQLRSASLSGNGTTTTFTSQWPHGFSSGDTVTVAGGSISTFNGSFTITVTTATAFTYLSAANGSSTTQATARRTAGAGVQAVGADIDTVEAQYASTDQNLMNGLYAARDSYRTTQSAFTAYLQSLAQQTLIQMANEDTPLTSKDVTTAVKLLISQMADSSDFVQTPTITVTVTPGGSNTSNGVCVASNVGPSGLQQDYAIGETMLVTCTSDSQGSATLGSEPLSIKGVVAQPDPLQWDYPLGSGVNKSTTAVDASLSQGTNVLKNSSFDTFTVANTPDNWTIVTGSAGTTVFNGGSGAAFVTTGSCLQITGASTNTKLTQAFNQTSGGTTIKLQPSTVYALNLWLKVSSVPAAGSLEIGLTNTSGTYLQNDQAVDQKLVINLTGATTSYVAHNVFFQTPSVLPSTTPYKLQIKMATDIDTGKSVYIDTMALVAPPATYAGGPYIVVFSGATKFVVGDYFSVAIKNLYDSQWQSIIDQLLNPRSLGIQIASSGSPTIAESLIS